MSYTTRNQFANMLDRRAGELDRLIQQLRQAGDSIPADGLAEASHQVRVVAGKLRELSSAASLKKRLGVTQS